MKDLLTTLGIKTLDVTKTKAIISLPITDSIKQPFGLVHGGVNAVLAETAASLGANQNVAEGMAAAGVNISTQHLLPVKSGTLIATATPLHVGNRLQTWQVTITVNDVVTSTSTVTLTSTRKP